MLLPTLVGAVLLGLFALDLGWTTHGAHGRRDRAEHRADLRRAASASASAIDLAGLAIAGGLFIVPTFSAVQAWAGADRRARVIAAVNVLNAAVHDGGRRRRRRAAEIRRLAEPLFCSMLGARQRWSSAVVIARTMPTNLLRDFLTVMYRSFFRLEVVGLENVAKAGPNAIIALNHVSFLDAAVALSFLGSRAGVRHRQRDRAALVGEAVPEVHPRRCRSTRPSRWRRAR